VARTMVDRALADELRTRMYGGRPRSWRLGQKAQIEKNGNPNQPNSFCIRAPEPLCGSYRLLFERC